MPHRPLAELERLWAAAPAPAGVVRRVVARTGGGQHRALERGRLTVAEGLVGDRWSAADDPARDCQVTLMAAAVVAALGGDAEPGDNLIVDLDLSEAALPAGARLRVGGAIVEVTAEPHLGCRIFAARFGTDALKWVNGRAQRPLRLRGVNARVVSDGDVAIGDPITRAAR